MTDNDNNMSLPQTRSTTTFTSGSSLTITNHASLTLITRHPRTIPTRLAERRSKALLTKLSTSTTQHIPSNPIHILILLTLPLLTLVPLSVHILHGNALITTLTHIPAAICTGVLVYLCYTLPHITYFAVSTHSIIHRSRGLLRKPQIYPLSTIRHFFQRNKTIVTDSTINNLTLDAPDHETASAAVQALNNALSRTQHTPPPILLEQDGQLVITTMTALPNMHYQQKLRIERTADRVIVTTLSPNFPKLVFLFLYFFLTHTLTTLLLIFIFDDMPSHLRPISASTISAISVAGIYVVIMLIALLSHGIRCIPRKWKLVVAGCRKDVQVGMIDVGRCREVVLSRNKNSFGVRVLSSTGNAFLKVDGLCEAEASTLLLELRHAFPGLFQCGV